VKTRRKAAIVQLRGVGCLFTIPGEVGVVERADIEERGLGMQAKMPMRRTKRKVRAWPER
jgi:hypothetical protein